ncbi:hypothetical protein QFZ68_005310 [Streptomyces sp. V1I6]|nr:hypothetical protein [Streptomyces sp. V1I6]
MKPRPSWWRRYRAVKPGVVTRNDRFWPLGSVMGAAGLLEALIRVWLAALTRAWSTLTT